MYFALLETEYIPKPGSQEAKNLVKISAMYKNLSYLLRNADLRRLSKMFSSMPVDVMEHFMDNVELTSQELSAYKVVSPMLYLAFFAYAFALASVRLASAWKKKKLKQIWLYLWIILLGIYFLVLEGIG